MKYCSVSYRVSKSILIVWMLLCNTFIVSLAYPEGGSHVKHQPKDDVKQMNIPFVKNPTKSQQTKIDIDTHKLGARLQLVIHFGESMNEHSGSDNSVAGYGTASAKEEAVQYRGDLSAIVGFKKRPSFIFSKTLQKKYGSAAKSNDIWTAFGNLEYSTYYYFSSYSNIKSRSRAPLGSGIYHPQNLGSRSEFTSITSHTTACDGTLYFPEPKYVDQPDMSAFGVQTQSLPKMPAGMRMLDMFGAHFLQLEELKNGKNRLYFSGDIKGLCKTTINGSDSGGTRFSEQRKEPEIISFTVETEFNRDQKVIPLTYGDINVNFSETLSAGEEREYVKFNVEGKFEFAPKPSRLVVLPNKSFKFVGPDKKKKFMPEQVYYTVKNTGEEPLTFQVGTDEKWLALQPQNGKLEPGASARVVALVKQDTAKSLKEGVYRGSVEFKNITNRSGDTKRRVVLDVVPEIQRWKIRLRGTSRGDSKDKHWYTKTKKGTANSFVTFGVLYTHDYTIDVTLKKKEGTWVYESGVVKKAKVTVLPNCDSVVFDVKGLVCTNCAEYESRLVGMSLPGFVDNGRRLTIAWGSYTKKPKAILSSEIKVVVYDRGKRIEPFVSSNHFSDEFFFEQASMHRLPLKSGTIGPIKLSTINPTQSMRKSLKVKRTIDVVHAYSLQRLE